MASRSPRETRRNFSRSRFVRMGCGNFNVWQFSGVSTRMLRSVPIKLTSDITISSRMGSIGGLVTCANNCLK
jgi:hypothetical protein